MSRRASFAPFKSPLLATINEFMVAELGSKATNSCFRHPSRHGLSRISWILRICSRYHRISTLSAAQQSRCCPGKAFLTTGIHRFGLE